MTSASPLHPEDLDAGAVTALLVDTTPWLSCDECFDQMDTHVEALVANPDHRDDAMANHLRGCAACQEEARSLVGLLTDLDPRDGGRGEGGE